MNMRSYWKYFFKYYGVYAILTVAAVLRLLVVQYADYASFPEQWRDFHMVSGIAHGTFFPQLGPPSMVGGFHFSPHYYYLMVPLFVLSGFHPVGLLLTGVAVSTLSVYVLYRLLLLWSNNASLALTGALLSAVSAYSLHLVSYTSNPNFLPLFVLWFLYCLTKILQGSTQWFDYAQMGLAFALASCLHTTATLELPVIALLGLPPTRPTLRFRLWCIAGAAAFVVYAPYLYYELTHGFSNTVRLFGLGASALHGGQNSLNAHMLWNFWEGTLTPFNYWYGYTAISPNWLYWLVTACMALAAVCFLAALRSRQSFDKRVTRFSKAGTVLLWSWICVASITLLLYTRGPHDHYIIILWPAPLIVLTWAVFWFKERFGVFKPVLFLLLVTALLQIYSFTHVRHQPWRDFLATYEANYKNRPDVSEIGAVW